MPSSPANGISTFVGPSSSPEDSWRTEPVLRLRQQLFDSAVSARGMSRCGRYAGVTVTLELWPIMSSAPMPHICLVGRLPLCYGRAFRYEPLSMPRTCFTSTTAGFSSAERVGPLDGCRAEELDNLRTNSDVVNLRMYGRLGSDDSHSLSGSRSTGVVFMCGIGELEFSGSTVSSTSESS
jgi:hypothetical protein